MTRSFYAIPAIVCLAAAVVTAQAPADRPAGDAPAAQQQPAPAQPPAQQPTTPKPTAPPASETARPADPASATSANLVTYSGCIKAGTTPGTWVLENVEAAARPGASTPGTVGTSGTSKTMVFDLDPAATVNLKAHANHKVELNGTLSPAKSTMPSASAPPSSAPGAATAQIARQQFSVQGLKMVSATCP